MDIYAPCMCLVPSGQMPDSVELELETVVSYLVSLRVKSKSPLEEQPVPVTAELFSPFPG